MVVVALVVVVAGSLLTLVVRLDEVSASAVTERVDDSDAFLHDSTLCTCKKEVLNKDHSLSSIINIWNVILVILEPSLLLPKYSVVF